MLLHTPLSQERRDPLVDEIIVALELGAVTLNEIDFDDIIFSEEVMLAIGRMSGMILRRYIPDPSRIGDELDEIMSILTERAFWVRETGMLIICATIGEDNHFIQVPARQWGMKRHDYQ